MYLEDLRNNEVSDSDISNYLYKLKNIYSFDTTKYVSDLKNMYEYDIYYNNNDISYILNKYYYKN